MRWMGGVPITRQLKPCCKVNLGRPSEPFQRGWVNVIAEVVERPVANAFNVCDALIWRDIEEHKEPLSDLGVR